jgi:hypothetical protein
LLRIASAVVLVHINTEPIYDTSSNFVSLHGWRT